MEALPWAMGCILVPLVAALVAFVARRHAAGVGLAAAPLIAATSAGLAWKTAEIGAHRHRLGGWDAPLGIELLADGLSVSMVVMTSIVGLFVSLYARGYFAQPFGDDVGDRRRASQRNKRRYFWPLWFVLWAALHALFLSADLFNLYVCLELVGLAAVALVALEGGDALGGAMRYLLVTFVASLSYLLGVGLLYSAYGVLELSRLGSLVQSGPVVWASLALMSGGLLLKTAIFPLHFWLPPAHANAPTPVSAVLSALVVKSSFYMLIRLWLEVFATSISVEFTQIIAWLGMVAILWGGLQALLQTSLKMLVAYSTVAQLGYLFLIFLPMAYGAGPAGAWNGGVYYAVSHAFAKGAMFMSAGTFLHALGDDDIEALRGTGWTLRMNFFSFALAGLTLIGLPPSGGFIGKWLIAQAAIQAELWFIVAVIFGGGLLAAAYVLRVVQMAFVPADEAAEVHPVPLSMQIAPFLLALVSVFMGLVARGPVSFLEIGAPFEAVIGLGGSP